MQLSMNGEYAMRAMLYLAQNGQAVAHIGDISRSWDIPENLLRKLIPRLTRANLIESKRGKGGGIVLARPADTITALQVIEAVDGQLYLHRCLLGLAGCDRTSWCSMHVLWIEARKSVRQVLNSKTLAELVAENIDRQDKMNPDSVAV